jgi:hypothetical protein
MEAAVGDELIIEALHLGRPRRVGVILEVRGPDGSPPYMVQWDDRPHPVLFFPGNDAHLEHAAKRTTT